MAWAVRMLAHLFAWDGKLRDAVRFLSGRKRLGSSNGGGCPGDLESTLLVLSTISWLEVELFRADNDSNHLAEPLAEVLGDTKAKGCLLLSS
jgi:hypothetical protein